MLQAVAPRLRKMVRDAAGADDEADDDAPGRPSMLLGALLVVAFRAYAWARYVPGLEYCVHNLWAASRWVRRRYRSSSAAALPYTAPLNSERRACASASAVHAPTVRLLEGAVTRSDSVGAEGRAGYAEGREVPVGRSATGATDDCESVKSEESTVSQALARLRWYERHLGTDLLLSSWLWLVGCVAYALNSGAELYASCCPISSDLGHIYGAEIGEIGEIAGGDVYLSVGAHLNLSAEAEQLWERGGNAKTRQLGDAPALLGAAGALRRTLELLDTDLPGHAHAPVPLFDPQSCASVASLILWCDFISAALFVVGCCVLLYSAYPEQLLHIADALSRPPRELSWLETYFTSNLMLATTQIFMIGTLLCRNQAGSAVGQLALRRPLSAPNHASGCPELRPASANQPLGPCWPAIYRTHSRHRHAAARAAGAAAHRRRAGQPGRVRAAPGPARPAAAAALLVVYRDGLQPAQERRPRLELPSRLGQGARAAAEVSREPDGILALLGAAPRQRRALHHVVDELRRHADGVRRTAALLGRAQREAALPARRRPPPRARDVADAIRGIPGELQHVCALPQDEARSRRVARQEAQVLRQVREAPPAARARA